MHVPPPGPSRDRGAAIALFGLTIALLIGSGALVVDIGQLYSERRQLQNGADAAAFAVVRDCVNNASCAGYTARAQTYANLNSRDGISGVREVCGVAPALPTCASPPTLPPGVRNWVRVRTRTQTPSGGTQVPFVLAPILDVANVGQTVNASAVVGYGPLGATKVIPLALSRCTFDARWIGADGSLNFPATDIRIGIHSGNTCLGGGYPDGFDFLAATANCSATQVSVVNGVAVVPAGPEGTLPDCRSVIAALHLAGQPVIFPVFVSRTPAGSTSTYTLAGFAAFLICGYTFEGGFSANTCSTRSVCDPNPAVKGTDTRICGRYVPISVTDGEWSPGDDFGARLVKGIG